MHEAGLLSNSSKIMSSQLYELEFSISVLNICEDLEFTLLLFVVREHGLYDINLGGMNLHLLCGLGDCPFL